MTSPLAIAAARNHDSAWTGLGIPKIEVVRTKDLQYEKCEIYHIILDFERALLRLVNIV